MQAKGEMLKLPLIMAGGTKFGRYPKISKEQTWNMLVSDSTLVDYAGYKNIATITADTLGRAIHTSTIGNFMIVVVGSQVYRVNTDLVPVFIPGGNLATDSGEVYIAENNNSEIAITDGVNIYIYNYSTNAFVVAVINANGLVFKPGFISFQNTRFVVANLNSDEWILGAPNAGTSWPNNPSNIGTLQTKPDRVQAAVPFPGRGNQLFLFGSTVAESWTDVGAALFPYQRNSSFNVDYGCLNPSSIAYQDQYIVWLGISEEAGPVLMYSTGGDVKEISTDGIDFQLSNLTAPHDCTGFMIKLDGHLLYQFTFKTDNVSYIYDFTTQQFFNVSDEYQNYHIARKVVFFNNDYYFVSFNDGNLYRIGTQYTNYQYSDTRIAEIPRIRITPPIRLPSQNWFIIRDVSFTMENGQPNIQTTIGQVTYSNMVVDLSISRDGGEDFGSSARFDLMPTGHRKSKIIFYRLGQANDVSFQIRFSGFSRFVAFDGEVNFYS